MTIESMIPTFEVGERVRVYFREYEWFCPNCGERHQWDEEMPETDIATILPHRGTLVTHGGKCVAPITEGFYHIKDSRGEIVVPYTLLEKIDAEMP